MKKSAFCFILLSSICILIFSACDKNKTKTETVTLDAVEALKTRGTLVIGYDYSFPPLAFTNDNGEIVGYDIDLAKEVAKRMGVSLKPLPIDWDDKDNELEIGTIDCIWSGYTITDARKKAHSLTFPYLANEQILIVRKEGTVKSYDDLQGRVVGLRSASSSEDAINNNASFKNKISDVIAYKDNKSVLDDLSVGLIDAMVMDSVFAYYYIAQTGEPFEVIPTPLSSEEYSVCFRKNEPELRDYVEKILLEMAADGTIAEYSKKWFGQDVSLIGK